MAVYMMAVRIVAMSRPPHPPSASPNCQPPICPEMTYATPSPAKSTQPAAPFCNWRYSRYSSPTFSYSTPCVVRLSDSLTYASLPRIPRGTRPRLQSHHSEYQFVIQEGE